MLSLNLSGQIDGIILWKFQTGGPITASPMIRDGIVYIGCMDKNFYAVDAVTGSEKWHYETGEQIRSNAAFFENGLCFESGNQLYALNFQGEFLWQFALYSEALHNQYDSWNYFHSSPVIVDGIAYIGTENGLVYGVNITDGAQAFQCRTGNEYGIRVAPAIYNNTIYFGDWNGVVYAFDLTDGNKLWEYDTKNDNAHSWTNAVITAMIIENDMLYFAGKSCNVYALNPSDGSLIWKWHSPTDQWMVGGPVIQNDRLYIGSSDQHLFYGFDALTGKEEFECLLDFRVFGGGAIGETCAYVGSGSFYSVDKTTGEIMKRLPTDQMIVSRPILSDGILYFGCYDECLYAVDQQRFDAMLMPDTFIRDETELYLGEISRQTSQMLQVPVYNSGAGSDSVIISLSGSTKIKKAVTLTKENFIILPGDSAVITGNVAPEDLKTGEYTLNLMIHSYYNLEQNDMIKPVRFTVIDPTNIKIADAVKPGTFSLHQNTPNPFNPVTQIVFSLSEGSEMTLTIYNNLGHEVAKLANGYRSAGEHQIVFNAHDLSSGVYMCVLKAGNRIAKQKMLLLK